MTANLRTIKRAIVSVSNKSGIADFVRILQQRWNVEIISTGGTLKTLREAGIIARSISDVTGFPEILDGRVKTLHPTVHAGLLAISNNPEHQRQLADLSILPIDLVVVNLYPFEETISASNPSLDEAIEQIDIGGPAMLRAAAKNYKDKTVVVRPADYDRILTEMETYNGATSETTRFRLAKEVFLHTARYDSVVSNYLASLENGKTDELPEVLSLSLPKRETLRYGENPHQRAALYGSFDRFFEKLRGKELSYNNLVDIQAAAELIEEFSEPTAAVIKHTNPCGVGSGKELSEAYGKAVATDPKSAFGGIVAVNRVLDVETARMIDKIFTEVIIAPEYSSDAIEFLCKKRDRRLMRQKSPLNARRDLIIRHIAGGALVQTPDNIDILPEQLKVVTRRQPTDEERAGMLFGWRVAKHTKSNAIVYARSDRTVAVGAGQMSRVDSSKIAVMKAAEAGLDVHGSAVASDAFFPFADGLLAAVQAGATAVIQPGGSVRDAEVIKAADENNITMIFTGIRHFKH